MRTLLILCLGILCFHTSVGTTSAFAQERQAAFDSSPTALFKHLAGRWGGSGTIKWFNGAVEPFKCVTTFFIQDGAGRATQNFRCNGEKNHVDGSALRIELSLDWILQGERLTGTWHERIYEVRGTASGQVKGNQIVADIQSEVATAKLSLTVHACEVRAVMHFNKEIERLDASGRKC
ncbi:MAG: hypothetical protein F9K29_11265 [Hyphomicrobiaceae bacterium]|nr:MAG: hypothetical protein F9K29_11265 [Hyphomicrobiaceae bacterium]